ncbi:MAG: hypothetical protein HND57_02340 [Planctomycetes bacterium]|nr:hypothetical protein [Planctomycetota bacterium]
MIKRVLIGAAAVLVGWAIFFSGGESDGGKIELITGTNAVLAAINDMQITDAEKAPLIAQAEQQRLEMWQFTVFPSSSGSGETYAVFTDLGAHTYSITNSTQTFLLPATMGSQGFSFTANADNQNPGMYTKWFTPQGTFPYDMQAGDSYQVPVR